MRAAGPNGQAARLIAAAAVLGLLLSAPAGAEVKIGDELLTNGDFETLAKGWAAGWRSFRGASIAQEGGNHWLVIRSYGSVPQSVRIDPNWMRLRLRFRMRVTGVVLGDEGWKDARLAMHFTDAAGKHVDPWPNVIHATGTTGWVSYQRDFLIPEAAARLEIAPALFGSAGTAEFDDLSLTLLRTRSTKQTDLPLPKGHRKAWDLSDAWRSRSATRETICLNGLWRFLPVPPAPGTKPPASPAGWGWFKVPGVWPAALTGEAQDLLLPPWTEDRTDLTKLDQAWYLRTIRVPAGWAGRRVLVDFTMLQTHARVLIDGTEAGEIFFPGGQIDLTRHVRPGAEQTLAVLVTARPLAAESTAFMAPDRIVKTKATVGLKGLTGDVFLLSRPRREALDDVRIVTSTRKQTIAVSARILSPRPGPRRLQAKVLDRAGKVVKTFASDPFEAGELADGRARLSAPWTDPKLWDTHTPQNVYDLLLTLTDGGGKPLDESLPVRFGFREFRIDGRDFYLNGKRIHLRCLHTRNINRPADLARTEACRATCLRMKEYGFNFLITANYNFSPGTVSYLDGLYQAADETGVLASLSLPHVKDFAWKLDTPAQAARYHKLCEWLIRRTRHHPSVVMYAMNHNATGYRGDQNPLRIDGVFSPDDPAVGGRPSRNRTQAATAAGIARALDPTRPVYHHQSGNLGELYTINIYLNWAPLQERSDWLEHWASRGVKPLFFVEWGLPHVSSWSSYRGPNFIWRSEEYQCLWDSEFNAAYVNQAAYRMTPAKAASLAHEEDLWSRGKPFHWGWLIRHFSADENAHVAMKALFANDNWRCLRTWGISAMLPWDQSNLWKRRAGTSGRNVRVSCPPERLKRPGIVADTLSPDEQYIYCLDANTVGPTVLGEAFRRWNRPRVGYVGGGPERFTEKGHNFLPGETVRKQLVVLNDTRRPVTCAATWWLARAEGAAGGKASDAAFDARGSADVRVEPGGRAFVPVAIDLPPTAASGTYALRARVDFGGRRVQTDAAGIDVLPPARAPAAPSKLALFDPKGATAKLLDGLGVKYQPIRPDADLGGYRALVIGREAIGPTGRIPDLARVRDGLKVLVFEQTAEVLSRRLGFRINVHGMRQAFVRAAGHPAVAGLADRHLRNWRGAATLTPPHLDIWGVERSNPTWSWCGFRNTRVWRCGNWGSVASVLIEKPPRGNWLPIVDCGFDLQYAPLLEYAEGRGRIVFCQMDVTGRTESDPAACRLCANLLAYLDAAGPAPARKVHYAGDARGADLLRGLGVTFAPHAGAVLGGGDLLVAAPGAKDTGGLKQAVERGLSVLCLGLSGEEIQRLLPGAAAAKTTSAVSATMKAFGDPALRGISNAELHWRTKLTFAALAPAPPKRHPALRVVRMGNGCVVFCQAAPWMFDTARKPYLRTTYRRNVFLVSRLLNNLGAGATCPLPALAGREGGLIGMALPASWRGRADRGDVGRRERWFRADLDDSAWRAIRVPGAFDEQFAELKGYDGLFWYRLRFRAPANLRKDGLTLRIGAVDDESWVWLNGRFLGEVTKKTNPKDYWAFPRQYPLPPGLLKHGGENVLVVRVNDTFQTGGIQGVPALTSPGLWLRSHYLQTPQADDDPYRYYRW